MADRSLIEWTDTTWQIVTGCSVVSPGCTHCYAMRLAGTRMKNHPSRAGLTVAGKAGPVWNSQVRFNAEWLTQPLRWKRPRRIFVAAHGDLFHEGVTDDQLDQIFAVMALSPQHTFQVLTKRPERMRAYLTSADRQAQVAEAAVVITSNRPFRFNDPEAHDAFLMQQLGGAKLPLPNVWLGVSVEDQARADERIPPLLATPAAVRWISAEPLLGPVDLSVVADTGCPNSWDGLMMDPTTGAYECCSACDYTGLSGEWGIDWVVAGGESGPGARPMHPDWARQLRDQCAAAGVPFLFKQWGEWAPIDAWAPADRRPQLALGRDGRRVDDDVAPEDVPGGQRLMRIGKKAAGRLLDGQLHDAFPEPRS